MLVISIGLLAAAGLQVLSKRANHEAVQRTTAAQLAYDLFERMRSNNTALADYLPASALGDGSLGTVAPFACQSMASPCEPAQLAQFDLWEWERTVDGARELAGAAATGGLAAPTACITGPVGGGPGLYTIAIAWRGTNPLTNPGVDNCGTGLGKYGTGDAYRRVLAIQTFITAS